jgi:membrane-associated phospholipid phosphatase
MDEAMQWGVQLILLIQQDRSALLDEFFRAITTLGGMGHVFIVPFVIWCLGYRAGSRMLITLLLSVFVNFALKDLFAQPRPFELEPRIGPDREFGYGVPSGHAQHTLLEWGLIAAWVRRRWFTVLAVLLFVLIGFSRVYLGVHFPTDVLVGWALGGTLLWLHLRCADGIAARLEAAGFGAQIALAAGVSGLFVAFYLLLPRTPYVVGAGGLFFGAAAGIAACRRWLRAPEGGALWQRALRYVLGIAILLTWLGQSGKWVPGQHDLAWFAIMYVNNAVGGLWLTFGAPALFQAARLTPAAHEGQTATAGGRLRTGGGSSG